jgi:hypothetical protein
LPDFISRNRISSDTLRYAVGRLKEKFRPLNKPALAFAISKVGTPYDEEFIYGNSRYYCTELIYDAYQYANGRHPFFELEPMTFKDPDTKDIFPAWAKYYDALDVAVPEGKPGCNPGGISRSDKMEIVSEF